MNTTNLIYFIIGLVISTILFLIGFFRYKPAAIGIVHPPSFGPKGYRIPYHLLEIWGIVKGKRQFIKKAKKEIIAYSIFIFAMSVVIYNGAGIISQIIQDLLKFVFIVGSLTAILRAYLGIDIGQIIPRNPDQETIDKVLNFCDYNNIQIHSFEDLKNNVIKFIHLLPIIDFENEDTFSEIPDENFIEGNEPLFYLRKHALAYAAMNIMYNNPNNNDKAETERKDKIESKKRLNINSKQKKKRHATSYNKA